MIIAVDFDGTIVQHCYPAIGKMFPHAIEALTFLKKSGHKIILWTCRNDSDPANNGRKPLTEAVEFMKQNGFEFDAINTNVSSLGFNPTPKIYADVYIDDRSLNSHFSWADILENGIDKPFDDVNKILNYFKANGYDIIKNSRSREIVEPRQIAMFVFYKKTKLSLAKIGAICGNRDHATVLHAIKTVDQLKSDKRYFTKYKHIFYNYNI